MAVSTMPVPSNKLVERSRREQERVLDYLVTRLKLGEAEELSIARIVAEMGSSTSKVDRMITDLIEVGALKTERINLGFGKGRGAVWTLQADESETRSRIADLWAKRDSGEAPASRTAALPTGGKAAPPRARVRAIVQSIGNSSSVTMRQLQAQLVTSSAGYVIEPELIKSLVALRRRDMIEYSEQRVGGIKEIRDIRLTPAGKVMLAKIEVEFGPTGSSGTPDRHVELPSNVDTSAYPLLVEIAHRAQGRERIESAAKLLEQSGVAGSESLALSALELIKFTAFEDEVIGMLTKLGVLQALRKD